MEARMRALTWIGLLAAGCGEIQSDLPDATGDTVAPAVVSTTPLDGASEVSPDTDIAIVFDEELDPATLGITVVDDRGAAVAGTVATTATGASFTPAAPLPL